MTKSEVTGTRSLDFSGWVRKNLPDSNLGFMVTDLDFILYNYKTKQVALLEVKTHGNYLPTWQENLFKFLNTCILNGKPSDWEYKGFFLIVFENTSFHDGKVFLNYKVSSEAEIKKTLSFY